MRKSKFSESQILEIRKRRREWHRGPRAAPQAWRESRHIRQVAEQRGATVSDVKRLRELEAENSKLKRMYADLALENAAIKDVLNRKL